MPGRVPPPRTPDTRRLTTEQKTSSEPDSGHPARRCAPCSPPTAARDSANVAISRSRAPPIRRNDAPHTGSPPPGHARAHHARDHGNGGPPPSSAGRACWCFSGRGRRWVGHGALTTGEGRRATGEEGCHSEPSGEGSRSSRKRANLSIRSIAIPRCARDDNPLCRENRHPSLPSG